MGVKGKILMVEVSVSCYGMEPPGWLPRVEPFIRKVLHSAGIRGGEMALVFCRDSFMIPLNEQYRKKKGSTDVLSFTDDEALASASEPSVQGDIILSLDQVAENSREFRVPRGEELKRLVIHGILHLAGEDHATLEPEEPMLRHQEDLLNRLKDEPLMESDETDQ